jgi:toxin FitB
VKFVLDTNVVSALRLPRRNPDVARRLKRVPPTDLYITALTVAEIERGVYARERTDPDQGAVLRRWFVDNVLPAFAGRVLEFNLDAARILAGLRVSEHAPYDDALIAATIQAHGMRLVSRNVKNFEPIKIDVIDPWHHDLIA